MKRKIALMISVLFFASSANAGGVGSLFDRAIRAGRNNNGCGAYTLQVPSSRNILLDDALQYMRNKGYILTKDYGTKEMIRFGYYTNAIRTAEFIPESELESYIANMPHTNQTGKAVIFSNSRKETINVYWSGSVNNGSINGNGVGYTKLNNSMYIIKGRFDNGIPNGSCEVVTATPVFANGRSPRYLQKTDQRKVNYTVGNSSKGYRSLFMNGKYGFINDRGDIVVSCQYGNVVQGFNDAGFAIVTDPTDDNQEVKINTNGTKLGYSDNQLRINEEKRLAKIAEEKRLAEEKRKKELKEQEQKLYNNIVSNAQNVEDSYNKICEYINKFPGGDNYGEVVRLKNAFDGRFAEIEKNKNYKKWSKGDKLCYLDKRNGLICGVLEGWNNNKTKAQVRIISGHVYNGANTINIGGESIYKDKMIWIGVKDGWHSAIDSDFQELASNDNLIVGSSGGYQIGSSTNSGGNSGSSDPKLNCVGRQICWNESVSFNISSGNEGILGSLLSSALGTDRVTYNVLYTAVVEAVLGDSSVKCVITNAQIQDPSWASVNYLKYKKQAASSILEDVGKTRVKQMNEFELK